MPCFAPGSDELVTTASNAVQSAQLRNALFAALSKSAASHFDDRNDLKFRGFEMVAILREAYAPAGDDTIFPNFRNLFSLEQGSKEELSTYMARVRAINGKLKAGGVELHRILLNMFTVGGLGGSYAAVKRDFALTSSLFSTLDIEGIETRCSNYASALSAIGDDVEESYVSAAGRGAAAPPDPLPPPTTGGNKPVFPSGQAPSRPQDRRPHGEGCR